MYVGKISFHLETVCENFIFRAVLNRNPRNLWCAGSYGTWCVPITTLILIISPKLSVKSKHKLVKSKYPQIYINNAEVLRIFLGFYRSVWRCVIMETFMKYFVTHASNGQLIIKSPHLVVNYKPVGPMMIKNQKYSDLFSMWWSNPLALPNIP